MSAIYGVEYGGEEFRPRVSVAPVGHTDRVDLTVIDGDGQVATVTLDRAAARALADALEPGP